MGFFDFFRRKRNKLSDDDLKWNKMWDLWSNGLALSPYAELMTYVGEVNNGGDYISEILDGCDNVYYANEDEITCILKKYAATIEL